MSQSDAWRRQFPTTALHDVVDAVVDLVAQRTADLVADRIGAGKPKVVQMGFSPREAAEYLGVSESTVRRLVDAGDVPAGRMGDRVIIRRSVLDDLMLGKAVGS